MPKFIVDLWLDGYETEEEMAEACETFIHDQLNFSGSGVKVTKIPSPKDVANQIVNVQPMPNDCINGLRELSKSEQDLTAEGYKPVSDLGLLWTKEDKE